MVAVNYLWDEEEDNIIHEYDEAGNTIVEYTTEPEMYGNVISQNRSGQTNYLHFDALGNTTELTSSAGIVTDRIRYTAFGEVTERTGSTEIPFFFHPGFESTPARASFPCRELHNPDLPLCERCALAC